MWIYRAVVIVVEHKFYPHREDWEREEDENDPANESREKQRNKGRKKSAGLAISQVPTTLYAVH